MATVAALDLARFLVRELRTDVELAALGVTIMRHAPNNDGGSPIMVVRGRGEHFPASRFNTPAVERVEVEAIGSTADVVLEVLSRVDRIANRPGASDFEWGNADGKVRILSSHQIMSPNPSDPNDEPDGHSHGVCVHAVAVG